jgi:hypothetical protein
MLTIPKRRRHARFASRLLPHRAHSRTSRIAAMRLATHWSRSLWTAAAGTRLLPRRNRRSADAGLCRSVDLLVRPMPIAVGRIGWCGGSTRSSGNRGRPIDEIPGRRRG